MVLAELEQMLKLDKWRFYMVKHGQKKLYSQGLQHHKNIELLSKKENVMKYS